MSVALVAGFIGAVVSTIASIALSAMMSGGQKPPQVEAQDRKQTIRGSIEARRVVYGEARVGGVIVYAASAGPDRERLHLVVVLAGHPCQSVESVWIGDTAIPWSSIGADGSITDGAHPLAGKVRIWRYLGNQTTADARLMEVFPVDTTPPTGAPSDASILDLPSISDEQLLAKASTGGFKPGTPLGAREPYYGAWTSAHVLRGCTYVHVELTYDRDKFPNGLQNISAVVRGKNDIWDPRSNATGFTDNWALCVLDYLRSDFGLACASDELDLPFFQAAANQADEAVPLAGGAGAATEPRWRLHGSFDLDRTPLDIVEGMVAAGAGDLVYVQGKYRLYGGAYRAPTASIGPSDFAGTVKVTTKPPRRELFNAVRGTFIDPARNYQAAEFPSVFDPAFDAADGERIWRDLQLPFVRSVVQAQRVARIALLSGRDALSFTAPMKYSAIRFAVKQTVSVTHPDFGWSAKPFSIESWKFAPATGEVEVTFREHNAFNYAWLWENAAVPASIPDTALIDPLAIPAATGVSLTSTTQIQPDGTAVPALAVAWTAAPHPFVTAHEVQWRPSGGQWTAVEVPLPATRLVVPIAAGGVVHEARVRPVGGLARGPWTDIASATAAPDTTAPGMPSGLTATGVLRGVSLNWTPPSDLDLARSEIQEAAASTGPWTKVGEADGSVFLRSGMPAGGCAWFRVRAVDRSGNAGPFTAAVQGTAALAQTTDIANQAVTLAKFASGIEPITVVSSGPLPTTKSTEAIVYGGKLYRWNGAAYTAAVPTVDLSGTLSDAQIADLNAAKLTGTMDPARIAAGALDDTKLRGGAPGNQIWNSTLDRSGTGWIFSGSATPSASGAARGTSASLGGGANDWRLSGYGSGFMARASLGASDWMDAAWRPNGEMLAVMPGARYEMQALVLPRNCEGLALINWHDAAGTFISQSQGNAVLALTRTDGLTEDRYVRSGVIATAPASARYAIPYVMARANGTARTSPSVVFTKAYFGEARPNQVDLSPWTPGAFSTNDPAAFGAGRIVDDLLAGISASKLIGTVADAQIAGLAASKVTGQLSDAQLAGISAAKVAGSLANATLPTVNLSGSVSSAQIAALDGAKLLDNTVVGAKVVAGAITASRLTLTTGNLNPDPQFRDAAWWVPDASGWYFEDAAAGNYPLAMGVARSATIWSGGAMGSSTARRHIWTPATHPSATITPGQTLRLRAEARNDSNQNINVEIQLFNAAGTFVSGAALAWTPGEGNPGGLLKSLQIAVPNGAAYWRLVVYNQAGTAFSGAAAVSDVILQVAADASLIVDGSITTAKLTASAVTANEIAADAVTAGKIQAGAIVAGKLAAGAVVAGNIAANAVTATEIAAGSVTTAKIAAGAVTAGEIASGAVTTGKLAVASSNQCWNGTWENGSTGWTVYKFGSWSGSPAFGAASVFGSQWVLAGVGSGYLRATGVAVPSGQGVIADWRPSSAIIGISVAGRQRVQAAALFQAHRCRGRVEIHWIDSAGATISVATGNTVENNALSGAVFETQYARSSVVATAPGAAGTALFRVVLEGNGGTDPYLFLSKAMIGVTAPNATEVAEWDPGGATSIDGGMVRARSVAADRLLANSVSANEIAAGSIYTAAIQAGAVTADRIAANTITASQIASGAVTTPLLAAGAITASKLAIMDETNVVPDGAMADDAAWSFGQLSGTNTWAWQTNTSSDGFWGGSRRLDTYGTGSLNIRSRRFTVSPDRSYRIRGLTYATAALGRWVYVDWFAGDGTYLGATEVHASAVALAGTAYDADVTPPAGAAAAEISMVRSAGASATIAFGRPLMQMRANGALIVDGAITATKIAASAVETAKIAAGAVTTEKLAVGSANQIANSCAPYSTWGWGQLGLTSIFAAVEPWRLRQYGSLALYASGTRAASYFGYAAWNPDGYLTPVVGGRRYQISGLLQAHRCRAYLEVWWFTAGGSPISGSTTAIVENHTGGGAGLTEADYLARGIVVTAPASAAQADFRVVMQGNGGNEPYVFATKLFFGEALANATELAPWAAGGLTTIEGGAIKAGTVTANEIAANAITSAKIAANAITAGKIAAGAISAAEIAAGAITATKLSVTEALITNAIQVQDLVVGTTKISNNAVTTFATAGLGSSMPGNGAFQLVCQVSVTVSENREAVIMMSASQSYAATRNHQFQINEIPPGSTEQFLVNRGTTVINDYPSFMAYRLLTPGTWTFRLYWLGQDSALTLVDARLTVLSRAK